MSFIHRFMLSSSSSPSSLLLYTRTASFVGRSWTAAPTSVTIQPQPQLLLSNNHHQTSLASLLLQGACTTFLRCKHTLKTNKSVSKRFRVRGGSGHKKSTLTHMRSGAQHNTGYRTRAAINKLGQSKPVANKKVERKMKQCMGVL